MISAAVSSIPPAEPDLFSTFLERSAPDALLRELSGDHQETPALRDWFAELLHLCRRSGPYERLLAAATSFVPEPGRPVFSAVLAATPFHRLSLMGIHPAKPVPLHDHPCSWSAQMVVSGRATIHHCDCLEDSTLPLLESVSLRKFDVHGISSVTHAARNIHALGADSGNVLLLSIQTPPCDTAQQSWFFPLEPLLGQGPLLRCHRVRKKSRGERTR